MIVLAVAVVCAAAVPDVVVLAGNLSRDGANVDGPVNASFTVFDAETGGNVVGATVNIASLEVIDGVFVAELAGVVDAIADVDAVFVEVVVDGETLQPRMLVGTVPFAAKAGAVDFADVTGVPADLLDGDAAAIDGSSLVIAFPFALSGQTLTIQNGGLSGDLLADSAVRNEKILAGAVISSKIANDAVQVQHIASGAVGADEIGSGAVGNDELQNNSISSNKLQGGAINRVALQGGVVGTNEVEDNSLGQNDLGNNAVGNAELADNAVSGQKIQGDAIARAQLFGSEVDVFVVDNNFCDGFGLLSTATTCRTRVCGLDAGNLRFFDCGGTCNQGQPANCTLSNRVGRLLSPSMP